MRVEVDYTRKDWRIRKPGDYASVALSLRLISNTSVTMRFEGFDDLAPETPFQLMPSNVAPIPTFYAVGSTLGEADAAGWWSARELNNVAVALDVARASPGRNFAEDGRTEHGRAWTLWQRLMVTPHQRPAEYEGRGRVILILDNLDDAVVDNEHGHS